MEIETMIRQIVREELEKTAKKEMKKQEELINLDDSGVIIKVTYEIEEHLHEALKIRAVREKRNVSEICKRAHLKKGLE